MAIGRNGRLVGRVDRRTLLYGAAKEIGMALELRPNCERCDVDLPPEATIACICTYECTYCAPCVTAIDNVCPNCGGGFAPRPIRPAREWRPGLSRHLQPPSEKRRHLSIAPDELKAFSSRIREIPPERR
jgi:hypothetical protein